jgi:hypothetical protein
MGPEQSRPDPCYVLLTYTYGKCLSIYIRSLIKGEGLYMGQHTNWRLLVLLILLAGSMITLLFIGPIPQDVSYHHFADQRNYFNIPNFFNVITNGPFLIIGFYATVWLSKTNKVCFYSQSEILPYLIYFVSVAFIAIGSGYYHWNPNNSTLVFDRLPMTIAFMSFLSLIIAERINLKLGLNSLVPLIFFGIASVVYWYLTAIHGHGDLRPYALVQFYPMLAIPWILIVYPAQYTEQRFLWFSLLYYILAKLCEWQDRFIYQILEHVVSGHALKHLMAAMATYCIFLYLKKRRQIR